MSLQQTLYQKDIAQNVRVWTIVQYENRYTISHGILNGASTSNTVFINYGKNIGKSNETSPTEQCISDVKSLIKRKKQEGYKSLLDLGYNFKDNPPIYLFLLGILSSTKTDPFNHCKPMKAKPYTNRWCIDFPAFGQPKINGVRATIKLEAVKDGLFGEYFKVVIRSKESFIYDIPHLSKLLAPLLIEAEKIYPNIVLDGELYIPGKPVTSIGGAARNKDNPLNSELAFWCFDLSIPIESQRDRFNLLDSIFTKYTIDIEDIMIVNKQNHTAQSFYIVPNISINNETEAFLFRDDCIKHNFEGAILRDTNAEYSFGGRVSTMRKLKVKSDSEFQIIDIIASDKNNNSIFICKNDINDLRFNIDGTREYLNPDFHINKHEYIGKFVTIEFFERTINMLPFHATMIGIRDYEQ